MNEMICPCETYIRTRTVVWDHGRHITIRQRWHAVNTQHFSCHLPASSVDMYSAGCGVQIQPLKHASNEMRFERYKVQDGTLVYIDTETQYRNLDASDIQIMTLPPPILYDPSQHSHLLPKFAQIHCAVVENDHTLATFLPPFANGTDQRVLHYWKRQEPEIIAGTRITVIQMMSSRVGDEDILAGYVSLEMPPSETGPFRGVVQKLLVDPKFRRKGIARRLMEKVEEVAREKGRSLLVGALRSHLIGPWA